MSFSISAAESARSLFPGSRYDIDKGTYGSVTVLGFVVVFGLMADGEEDTVRVLNVRLELDVATGERSRSREFDS